MSKKKITLDEVLKPVIHEDYLEQVAYVHKLIKAGTLKPMKSSRGNGKSPALALKYWLIEEDQDYSAYKEELAYPCLGYSTMFFRMICPFKKSFFR